MSSYLPALTSEDTGLRAGVEGVLDGDDQRPMASRIDELTDYCFEVFGAAATFGVEIECQFVDDPTWGMREGRQEHPGDRQYRLYHSVIDQVDGPDSGRKPLDHKGQILPMRRYDSDVVAVNPLDRPSPDGQGFSVMEFNIRPGHAVDMVDSYWKVIGAIGKVAEDNGSIGLILSTHVNAGAVLPNETLAYFGSAEDAPFLAATQHNLNSLYPLQLDSGIEPGIVALEAFPRTKDAGTTVHPHRMEFRHSTVGVVDPRIDALATLCGLKEMLDGDVAESVKANLRKTEMLQFDDYGTLLSYLGCVTVVDKGKDTLTMPAVIDSSAHGDTTDGSLSHLINHVLGVWLDNPYEDNAALLRKVVGVFRYDREARKLVLNPPGPLQVCSFLNKLTSQKVYVTGDVYRVLPKVFMDGPEVHRQSRANIFSSSVVRKVLGDAARSLVSADESIARRDELVCDHMVVLD